MSDLPAAVEIDEEGPREGFQIEKSAIPSADKIALIEALATTGLRHIQAASFVNPKHVPGWADAEAVVGGLTTRPGVDYTALWFNEAGMKRALAFRDKLALAGLLSVSASEAFGIRNLNRDRAGQIEAMRGYLTAHLAAGLPIARIIVMAAFGCNFSGDVAPSAVVRAVGDALEVAAAAELGPLVVTLADSMGWATPARVAAAVGAVRERWPDVEIGLHLHDTRGLGIACAWEGLRLGVTRFDAAVAGLGGCPFAGQPGAVGNIATEELALLCEESGVATGIDIDALIDVGRLAERILGRQLPSAVLRAGTFTAFRRTAT